MSTSPFVRFLVQDPDNPGDLMLDLGLELCQELGWEVGDCIVWIPNNNGSYTLRNKTMEEERSKSFSKQLKREKKLKSKKTNS